MTETLHEPQTESPPVGPWIGERVPRFEDERLLRGRGQFVDDFDDSRVLHVAVGRCPYPHASILDIDMSEALAVAGVEQILAGREVAARTQPLSVLRPLPDVPRLPFRALAVDRALYEGHPVVSVAATSRAIAEDALELVDIEYEPLPHVVDAEAALEPTAPQIWDELDSNLVVHNPRIEGDVDGALSRADARVADRFAIGRVSALPMEGRAIQAGYSPGISTLDVMVSTQIPHMFRLQLAEALEFREADIRLRAPDVGGGFGLKLGMYPEDVVVCLHAIDLGCTVRWIEDRMEHFRASTHAREAVHRAELGMNRDGTIQGMRDRYIIDMGAYNSPFGPPMLSSLMFPGPYRVRDCEVDRRVVATNKTPVGAYRGYGQPESNFVREILVDRAARSLELDPVEVRRRNVLRPHEMPWTNAGGAVYDSGDYLRPLEKAIEAIDYERVRAEQRQRDGDSRRLGIGVASFVEMTGYPGSRFLGKHGAAYGAHESVTLRANRSGGIDLYTGVATFGQATETTFAQITASVVGISPDAVAVHAGDTLGTPYNVGSFASRTTIAGAGAILAAGNDLRAKVLRIASGFLDAPVDALDLLDGSVVVLGAPQRRMALADIAAEAISGHHLSANEDPGLESTRYFDPPASAFGNGTAAAIVEVDVATGIFEVLRFVIAHDCGQQVNPALVEGQLHGGLAQGFGAAFFEGLQYDQDTGQMLNGTMVDYLVPTAADLPSFEIHHADVPSPVTPLGIRGVGEAGTIPPGAAVANALCDALAPLRVEINRLPLTPESLWRAIEEAERRPHWGSDKGDQT